MRQVRSRASTTTCAAGLITALGLLLAGCSGAATASSTPSSAAPNASATPLGPAQDADALACQHYRTAAGTARSVLDGIRNGPVVPAGISFFLLPVRDAASASGVRDVTLAAAFKEAVAAVDDLDAQAQAKVPPGSDPVHVTVTVDPTRALAALAAVDKACGSRLPGTMPTS